VIAQFRHSLGLRTAPQTPSISPAETHASPALDWTVLRIDSRVSELERLARTITAWHTEFLAYLTTGRIGNGPTEAVNLLFKRILRAAHGFRNVNNYRFRSATALRNHPANITPRHHYGPTTTLSRVEPKDGAGVCSPGGGTGR
jgi:hypothetical protein